MSPFFQCELTVFNEEAMFSLLASVLCAGACVLWQALLPVSGTLFAALEDCCIAYVFYMGSILNEMGLAFKVG